MCLMKKQHLSSHDAPWRKIHSLMIEYKTYDSWKFNIASEEGWKTILSYWGPVTFQGRTVKLRDGTAHVLGILEHSWHFLGYEKLGDPIINLTTHLCVPTNEGVFTFLATLINSCSAARQQVESLHATPDHVLKEKKMCPYIRICKQKEMLICATMYKYILYTHLSLYIYIYININK